MNNDAETPLSPEQIEWSTIIFEMEKAHCNKLSKRFKKYLNGKRIICLDIPDDFDFMQEELVKLLQTKAGK